jgi:hypothetical protein
MASAAHDQIALMKEVLEAVKKLEANQVQLASNVDAISGRVNVLAGMKEVRDVAVDSSTPVKKNEPLSSTDETSAHDDAVPPSPSLPATQLPGDAPSSPASHAQKTSTGTSRIILT